MPDTRLILHVKGTHSETTELPKNVVRAAILQGQITHSQLIWSPSDNAWKQVRELPHLWPSQKLAPAPRPAAEVPKPVETIVPDSPTHPVARAIASAETPRARVAEVAGATPKVRVAATASTGTPQVRVATPSTGTPQVRVATASTGTPQVRVATASTGTPQVRVATASTGTPQVRVATASTATPQVRVATASAGTPAVRAAAPVPVRSTGSLEVKDDDTAHPLKWVCMGLGTFILLVFGGNYLLVDQPLTSNLGQTPYSHVSVNAYYGGGFLQPNVLVIRIPASSAITPDNLTDFLATLARDTPQNPITRDLFERVALTSGWTAQYTLSGYSWKELGGMANQSDDQRKEFLLTQMDDASGEPMMPASTLNPEAQEAMRDKAWDAFVTHFAATR